MTAYQQTQPLSEQATEPLRTLVEVGVGEGSLGVPSPEDALRHLERQVLDGWRGVLQGGDTASVGRLVEIGHVGPCGTDAWPRARPGRSAPVVRRTRRLRPQEADVHATRRLGALVAERERIARDLHDTAVQELFAAQLILQAASARPPAEVAPVLSDVVDLLDDVMRDIRAAIFGLTDRRHGESLQAQAGAVVAEAARMLGFRPAFRTSGPVGSIEPAVAAHVVPTLREALSNVARHAKASHVEVNLDHTGSTLVLRVADDGVGPPANAGSAGNGIPNVARRAQQLGGTMSLERNAGLGCTLTWTVPA